MVPYQIWKNIRNKMSMLTSEDDLLRYINGVRSDFVFEPLPTELCSTSPAPLADVDDETLLNASPALLSHVVRTAANGGLQVLGPENIPATSMIRRVAPQHRQADLITVGSVAKTDAQWPTFDGIPVDPTLVDDPYSSLTGEMALRTGVVTEAVAKTDEPVYNPVAKAMVTAAGVIALQGAPGVMGDASGLCAALERAWGLDEGTIEDMQSRITTPSTDLLRYVIRSDRTRPMCMMPVHSRQAISVHMGPTTRRDYGLNRSYDWARARAVAESIWYMSVRLEGKSISEMWSGAAPGDLNAPIDREGILTFQPGVRSVLAYPPEAVRADVNVTSLMSIPIGTRSPMVEEAITEFRNAIVLENTMHLVKRASKMVVSSATRIVGPDGNTIKSADTAVYRSLSGPLARGRDHAHVTRSAIFHVLRSAVLPDTAPDVASAFEAMSNVREVIEAELAEAGAMKLTKMLAIKLMPVGIHLRNSLAAEAGRLKCTLDDWYDKTALVLPAAMRPVHESTNYWVTLASYDIVKGNNPKWGQLSSAIRVAMVRTLIARNTSIVHRNPLDSAEVAVAQVASEVCSAAASNWSAYYKGTKDAAYMLSTLCTARRVDRRKWFLMGSLTWELRSRIAATAKATLVPPGETVKYGCIREISHAGVRVAVTVNASRPIAAYNGFIERCGLFTSIEKRLFKIDVLKDWYTKPDSVWGSKPMMVTRNREYKKLRTLRYVIEPSRLWMSLKAFVSDVMEDIVLKLQQEVPVPDIVVLPDHKPAEPQVSIPMMPFAIREVEEVKDEDGAVLKDGYYWLSDMGEMGTDLLDMLTDSLDPEVLDMFVASMFASAEECAERADELLLDAADTAVDSAPTVANTLN